MTLQPGPLSPGMIVSRSDIQCGEPCIAGTRVPARAIKDFHRAGYTIAQIHREYPGLTDEQLEAAIAFDGWITAPPGGWGSNPVPGRRVDVRYSWKSCPMLSGEPAEVVVWPRVEAFRLVDEATGESGSSAAPIPTEPVADRWADLERLAKAATPGPWKACGTIYEHMNCELRSGRKGEGQAIAQFWDGPNAFADGQFSAAANPTTVLELIAAARAKEAGE